MNLSIQQPRSRHVVVTTGILFVAAVWLGVFATGNDVEVVTGNVHDDGYVTQERAAARIAAPVAAVAPITADSVEDGIEYFEPRTYDCGTASDREGGFMSHWARPTTI